MRRTGNTGQRRPGCLTVLLVIVLVVLFGAWQLGYVDHWLYQLALQRAGEIQTEVSASSSAEEAQPRASAPEHYAYAQLNDEDRKKYRIVQAALETRDQQPYPTDDMDDLHRIFQCVQADHPELFYVDGVSMETVTNRGSGLLERVSVKGRFAYSPEEVAVIDGKIEEKVSACLAGLPEGADDYGKSKYLYEWLATNVAYDHATAALPAAGDDSSSGHRVSQTLEGVFLNGSAVCGGYASAFQFLMQKLGMQCVFVVGTGDGQSHAWCLAMLDGEYYYIDPTWADPQSESEGQDLGYVNYDYLNVTTSELMRDHTPTEIYALPECVAQGDNYYIREDRLFDYADEQRFGELVSQATGAGSAVQVKCGNESTYYQFRDSFVSNGRLGLYVVGGAYRYSCSDENMSIVVLPWS